MLAFVFVQVLSVTEAAFKPEPNDAAVVSAKPPKVIYLINFLN